MVTWHDGDSCPSGAHPGRSRVARAGARGVAAEALALCRPTSKVTSQRPPRNPRAGVSGWRGVGLQRAWALDNPAQGLLPGFLWADQIPAAGDRLGQGKQHQLLNGLAGLALPGAAGAEQGGGGLHRRKEKKRPHSRPLSRRVKAARVPLKGVLSNSHRALALALTLRRCHPARLLVLGRTIGEVLSHALHHG